MGDSNDLPTDNDGWFKRHIIEALNDLKKDNETMLMNQARMHEANVSRMEALSETMRNHDADDQEMFSKFREEIESLQPLKKLVYGAIALILVAFLTAIIATVITKH